MNVAVKTPLKASHIVETAEQRKEVRVENRVLVTPEIAAAWLDRNTLNRRKSRDHVEELARDMKSGRWEYNGDPIRFDSTGRLIDGQHRLHACVAADTPFETVVIYNLPPTAQRLIDIGKRRRVADFLTMDGVHYSGTISTTARMLLCERYGVEPKHNVISHTEVLEYIAKHPTIAVSARYVMSKKSPKGLPDGQITLIHWVGTNVLKVPKVADAFIDVMHTGIPTYEGCAAHNLRERMIADQGSTVRMTREAKYKLIKHAWNLFAVGKTVRMLRSPEVVNIEGVTPDMLA